MKVKEVKNEDQQPLEGLIRKFIAQLGEDTGRPGLRKTPQRAIEAYAKMLEGYSRSLRDEITTFDNTYSYNDLIYSGQIDFFSLCEHHLLPFFGTAHIAYVPDEEIIGLSKLARAVDIHSRRLQEQERLTIEVANELETFLRPKGVIVLLEGRHFCNMARGVQQVNSHMKTIATRGCFNDNEMLYNRFLQFVATPPSNKS